VSRLSSKRGLGTNLAPFTLPEALMLKFLEMAATLYNEEVLLGPDTNPLPGRLTVIGDMLSFVDTYNRKWFSVPAPEAHIFAPGPDISSALGKWQINAAQHSYAMYFYGYDASFWHTNTGRAPSQADELEAARKAEGLNQALLHVVTRAHRRKVLKGFVIALILLLLAAVALAYFVPAHK